MLIYKEKNKKKLQKQNSQKFIYYKERSFTFENKEDV